jgi:hypothetical protein
MLKRADTQKASRECVVCKLSLSASRKADLWRLCKSSSSGLMCICNDDERVLHNFHVRFANFLSQEMNIAQSFEGVMRFITFG